jgi:hypothetical protein
VEEDEQSYDPFGSGDEEEEEREGSAGPWARSVPHLQAQGASLARASRGAPSEETPMRSTSCYVESSRRNNLQLEEDERSDDPFATAEEDHRRRAKEDRLRATYRTGSREGEGLYAQELVKEENLHDVFAVEGYEWRYGASWAEEPGARKPIALATWALLGGLLIGYTLAKQQTR